MEKSKKQRESKYELIRLIGCVAITLSHLPCSSDSLKINHLIHIFNLSLGGFGVNIFVILGAWFLCKSSFKIDRIIRIVGQMVFYGLLLDILSIILGKPFGIKTMASGFMYWFPFGYTIMLLFAPLANRINGSIKKSIIITGGGLASIVTALGFIKPDFLVVRLFSKGLFIGPLWFMYVFIFTSELRSYIECNKSLRKTKSICTLFIVFLSMYFIFLLSGVYTIREMYSPLCLVSSASLFIFIHLMQIPQKRLINTVAAASFGIYLLQTHRVFRSYVWSVFDLELLSEKSVGYVGFCIIEVVLIFLLGIVIDKCWDFIWTKNSNINAYGEICKKIDSIMKKN